MNFWNMVTGRHPRHNRFFLPEPVLSEVFRGKFVEPLKQTFAAGKLQFHRQLQALGQPKLFRSLLRQLFSHHWVVYCKPPFGGSDQVLRYIGAYTHRVAISNHRLVSFTDTKVTFRWRDSAHHNKKRLMTLHVDEFLRRFLLHVLPRGFVRIRCFGFLCRRRRRCVNSFWPMQQPLPHRPAHLPHPSQFRCGPARSVAARWFSSSDSPPVRSHCVPHRSPRLLDMPQLIHRQASDTARKRLLALSSHCPGHPDHRRVTYSDAPSSRPIPGQHHRFTLVIPSSLLRLPRNHSPSPGTPAPSHSKHIALSYQTGQPSLNAPYRNHRGPTQATNPERLHRRGASDTVQGVGRCCNAPRSPAPDAGHLPATAAFPAGCTPL